MSKKREFKYIAQDRILILSYGDQVKTFKQVSLNELYQVMDDYCWRMGWR